MSGLYYMDRNEEVWGRVHPNCILQENLRSLDLFVGTNPDPEDLRVTCEALHFVQLRGHTLKFSGRTCGDQAKALLMYSKIPKSLLPRFPQYATQLMDFEDIAKFHAKYPVNLHADGTVVRVACDEFPVFAQSSLDKLLTDVLVPLFTFKKHSGLHTGVAALSIPFVKELLPELEQLYKSETATIALGESKPRGDVHEDAASILEIISDEEGAKLLAAFQAGVGKLEEAVALEVYKKNIVAFHRGEAGLLDKIDKLPMMNDGSVKYYMWNAGVLAAKDPRRHQSPYKMKGYFTTTLLTRAQN